MKTQRIAKITHEKLVLLSGSRSVRVYRADSGEIMIEWSAPDAENGNAHICTKVVLSEEAATATALCIADIFASLQDDADGAEIESGEKPE